MTKFASIILGFALIIGIFGLVYWQTSGTSAPQNTGNMDENTSGSTEESEGMSAAEVAMHNNATSCWSIINGNVYDLTSWIPQHPGGPQAILQLCGTDGSAKFNGQHGGAQMQAQIFAGFKIGVAQ